MKKRILTVGFDLASDETGYADLDSQDSLLDWDIILFKPNLLASFYTQERYRGRPSFPEGKSFQITASCEHWRREIKRAIDAGKTVIVFTAELEDFFIDTGERSYSGTGRNQKTTVHVTQCHNYQTLPYSLSPVKSVGRAMKLSPRFASLLAPYWKEFADESRYQVTFSGSNLAACAATRSGSQTVGAIFDEGYPNGTLLVLPDVDFYPDHFVKEDQGAPGWTSEAEKFAGRMVAAVVALDAALRTEGRRTPVPAWATNKRFIFEAEQKSRDDLQAAEKTVVEAQARVGMLKESVKEFDEHRALLYEQGKPLEKAIISALKMLGFTVTQYRSADSEFDVVFESEEGRLIGEAEGKDDKAVGIDKLRQLLMNVQEDLQREEVCSPAKAVLLGNGFRLRPLEERGEPFTGKCVRAAATSSTALVFVPDLFVVASHLYDNEDPGYAKDCRKAILDTVGRVTFPEPRGVGKG